jgi:hypothetical protein
VIELPLRCSVIAAIIGTLTLSMPSVVASGIGESMWAASSRPTASLSRMFDHETSRRSSTSRP